MKKDISNAESAPGVDRAFLNIIAAHRGGNIITEVSAAMKQVTAAVQLTGKGGNVTLEMQISPASKGDAGTLVFLPKVRTKVPEAETAGSIFYADADFNLVREDPNQQKLDLKVVEPRKAAASAPLKKVQEGE